MGTMAALIAMLMGAPANVMVCAPSKTPAQQCALKTAHSVKYYECVWAGKTQLCQAK
jgi:hypothetical protein